MASTPRHPTTPSGITDREARLASYFDQVSDRPGSLLRMIVTGPRLAAGAVADARALPLLAVRLTGGEADAVEHGVRARGIGRVLFGGARAVLRFPADLSGYTEGSARSKHTLRRKIRSAERAGVTWRVIDDPAERARLAVIAAEHERVHPIARYRNTEPQIDGLERFRLWAAAFDAQGEPLLLTVVPYDGEWSVLRYFRQLRDDPTASDTRYLMTSVLVQQLGERGVRNLVDEATPHWLSRGIRHFQRMLGFRLVRLRLVDRRGPARGA